MKFISDIREFHLRFGLDQPDRPSLLSEEVRTFRSKFMEEEAREYREADGLEDILDAIVDQLYVTIGTAYLHGLDGVLEEAWDRVHSANMKKVRAQRVEDSKRGSTMDVVKPTGWQAPSLKDLIK